MVLYIANGYRWDKTIADFVLWSNRYNLWCKMLYFGRQLEQELNDELDMMRHTGPRNLLELLPDEFTISEYRQMRIAQRLKGNGDATLRKWVSRGYLDFDDTDDSYIKTRKYQDRGRKI